MMDRELFRQALEALEIVTADVKTTPSAYEAQRQAITALRERLAQPNEFQPDWDAMAVMVEEQQRMAKRIDELEAQQKPWVKTYAGGQPNYTVPEEQAQEPVAWMHKMIDDVVIGHRPADIDRHPDRWTALYLEPKPCPTCEALARTVMCDQTYHDNISPQRKPLTPDQVFAIADQHPVEGFDPEIMAFARAIEAAHGIKGEA